LAELGFNLEYLTIRTHGKYIKYKPDILIITAFKGLEFQKDLRNYLDNNYQILASSADYIYDMRKTSPEKANISMSMRLELINREK
jgi:hypothetical protein